MPSAWEELQKEVPQHLRYNRDEDVVKMEAQVGGMLQAFAGSLDKPMTPKAQAEKFIVPLLAGLQGLVSLQTFDLLRYVQNTFARMDEDSEANATIGILAEDVELFQSVLQDVLDFIADIRTANPSNKGKYLDELRVKAGKLEGPLNELHDAIGDLALLESGEESDEDEGDESFIEFDEPEKTTEDDEPLIDESDNEEEKEE